MNHRTTVVVLTITFAAPLLACTGIGPLTESDRQAMKALRHTPAEIPALCIIEREAQSGRTSSSQRTTRKRAMRWHMQTKHGSSGWETRRLHSEVLKEECPS